ncbi:MAG TPA: dual specificity protein phosphatase [Phototrophicaceae bacterium]|nr:dual specificity protein phosphatase [Phototrophicaceae bacterium]
MRQIRPWLYVGKYSETLSRELLEANKIRAVLELAAPVNHNGMTTLYLPVDDGAPIKSAALANGVAFVRSEYAQGNRVLIACGAGISRSVTFAIAALKEEEGRSLLDAFREIAKAHPEGMPHPELWRSLCEYYDEDVPFLEMWREIRTTVGEEDSR